MYPTFQCDCCGIANDIIKDSFKITLSRCRCCMVYYCSKLCQTSHWDKHKEYCIPIEEIARYNYLHEINTLSDSLDENINDV